MSLLKMQCPACGAALDDVGESVTFRCPYCSTSFMVPQELLAARDRAKAEGSFPPGQASGRVLVQDDFASPTGVWSVGKREGGIVFGYEEGAYRIFLSKNDSTGESFCEQEFEDFDLEVDVSKAKGPKDGEYGVTCRADPEGGYVFWLTEEGYYGISKIYYAQADDEDDEYETLAEGEEDVLASGADFNHLRVMCLGERLILYLNGQKVLEADDDEFASGDIGLMATTGESGKGGLDVRFKNLIVREA